MEINNSSLIQSDIEQASFARVSSGTARRLSLRVGKIIAVYPNSGTVDVQWMMPFQNTVSGLELTKPYVGLHSGIHFIPEVGSIVTVGYSGDYPILLSYLLPSSYTNLLMGISDPLGTPTNIRDINPGEISIYSSGGSEIYVHDKLEFMDKYGDTIIIDPSDESIELASNQLYINNEAGNITMGMVERNNIIITTDGRPTSAINGGNAYTELKIKIKELSPSTINNDTTQNKDLANIVVGTLIDDNGKAVVNQSNNKIVCQIKMSSGALIEIDEQGLININQGNQLLPKDASIQSQAQSAGYSGATYINQSQQRVAREGDRIVIPITNGQTLIDPSHPDLEMKATSNLSNFVQLGSMFTCMGIPLIFVPSVPSAQIVGEITQGANGVFIGSLDKNAESQETLNNA